jgi:hypothetical protein
VLGGVGVAGLEGHGSQTMGAAGACGEVTGIGVLGSFASFFQDCIVSVLHFSSSFGICFFIFYYSGPIYHQLLLFRNPIPAVRSRPVMMGGYNLKHRYVLKGIQTVGVSGSGEGGCKATEKGWAGAAQPPRSGHRPHHTRLQGGMQGVRGRVESTEPDAGFGCAG